MDAPAHLNRLIVSAPFGNYIQPTGCTATLGTFTAHPRPGRLRRTLATVRRYRRIGAWVNKIGLRNPGIAWLAERAQTGRINTADKIVSIHGFNDDEWYSLLDHAAGIKPLGLELNMSCPNVGSIEWPKDLFARAMATGLMAIVKLPPVNYRLMFAQALAAGVRAFHCCNTLPVPAGGISGKPLKPVSLQCIRDVLGNVSTLARQELTIIGGGGITGPSDIDDYARAGATHFAIGTKVFSPVYLFTHRPLGPLIRRVQAG